MSALDKYDYPLKGRFSPLFLPTFDLFFGISFLKMILFCFAIILGLVTLVDNLENFDEFSKYATKNNIGIFSMFWILVKHYAAYAPSLVFQHMIAALPLAAAIIVVTRASLNREFTVMRASGVSIQRTIMPLIVIALLFGTIYTVTRDLYVPTLLRKSFVMNNKLRPAEIIPLKITPIHDGDNLYFTEMGHYDGNTGTAYNLRIEVRKADDFFAGNNRFTVYRAKKASLQFLTNVDNPNDPHQFKWKPEDGGQVTVQFANGRKTQPWTAALPTLTTPAMLERQVLTEMVMTWNDLLRFDDLEISLEIHRRLSEPLVSFAMLLVALPLIMHRTASGRPASYITNALIGLGSCGLFFILRSIFFSWGEAGYLPPVLAAQGAGLLFVGAGTYLLFNIEN